jgi:hypothetical protein
MPAASRCMTMRQVKVRWPNWNGSSGCSGTAISIEPERLPQSEQIHPCCPKVFRVLASNTGSLINYGERYRAGERISSCLAESTVNAVISKRFTKRQQMQWTKRAAHLLLQTRTRTLDGTFRTLFKRWYPGLANDNADSATQAVAA